MSKKKDAYYFSHDSNAKDDFKCMVLIEELGLEGYGIFWVLVETLREQENFKYPLKLLSSLARKYNTTLAKIEVVVKNYNLFIVENDTFFFSNSLNKRMELMNRKREQAKLAGIKSGESRRNKKIERTLNACSTNLEQLKESKVNKIKENICAIKKLSYLTSIELSQIDISKLNLEKSTINLIDEIGIQKVVDYSQNHESYLEKEILKK